MADSSPCLFCFQTVTSVYAENSFILECYPFKLFNKRWALMRKYALNALKYAFGDEGIDGYQGWCRWGSGLRRGRAGAPAYLPPDSSSPPSHPTPTLDSRLQAVYPAFAGVCDLAFTTHDDPSSRHAMPCSWPFRTRLHSLPYLAFLLRTSRYSTFRPTTVSPTPLSMRSGTPRRIQAPSYWPHARFGLPEIFAEDLAGAPHATLRGRPHSSPAPGAILRQPHWVHTLLSMPAGWPMAPWSSSTLFRA